MNSLVGGVLVLLLASLLACHRQTEPGEPTEAAIPVRCVAPTIARIRRAVMLHGTVEVTPTRHALVAPQAAGRLTAVLVREGDPVRRGNAVATVDARPGQDAVTQTRAALAGARAAADSAAATASRTERLFAHGIAARQDVEDSTARVAAAHAQAVAAGTAYDAAARSLSFATVRAPLDGVVLRTLRAAGDLVDGTAATPVVEIGDPRALELLANAAPVDLVQLAPGQTGVARFSALPGRSFPVHVATIAPAIDPTSGVGAVRLTLAATPAPPIGLAGEADVDVGAQEAARMIPETAIRGTPAGGSEVLICDHGRLRAKEVRLGARVGGAVAVLDGIGLADRVVDSDVLGIAVGASYQERP